MGAGVGRPLKNIVYKVIGGLYALHLTELLVNFCRFGLTYMVFEEISK